MTAPALAQAAMEARIVRYGDLKPCKTALIDAHTPGSDQKENFTIIGGSVSESPDQHVHIRENAGRRRAPRPVTPLILIPGMMCDS